MARTASLETSSWLPTYAWWPPPGEFDATVVLSPYHVTKEPGGRFHFTLRGYAGSREPVWEREIGELTYGEQTAVALTDLDLPDPPPGAGGILEVQGTRSDRLPPRGVGFLGMWVDAVGVDGGGYLIPTIPMRAAAKRLQRDDLQVVPGVVVSSDVECEVLLLNMTPEETACRLVAASLDGLVAEGRPFTVEPFSAWRGLVSKSVPGVRRLLAPNEGIGSLAIYAGHRLLPFFAYRRRAQPITSMDHTAPIFA